MTDFDFDFDADLGAEPTLGEDPRPKRGRGRPKGSKTLSREAKAATDEAARLAHDETLALGGDDMPTMSSYGNAEHAMKPLSVSQLAQVFRTDRKTAMAKLRGCQPVAKNTRGAFLYDLAAAAAYLVEPKIDIERYIQRLRPADLPPYLHEAYWSALKKRQEVEIKAGDLWETEKVLEVFSDLAKRIKSTVVLWTDQLEKTEKLTTEQREFFTRQCDALLGMVSDAYTGMRDETQTGSLLEKYREEATGQSASPETEKSE